MSLLSCCGLVTVCAALSCHVPYALCVMPCVSLQPDALSPGFREELYRQLVEEHTALRSQAREAGGSLYTSQGTPCLAHSLQVPHKTCAYINAPMCSQKHSQRNHNGPALKLRKYSLLLCPPAKPQQKVR